MCFRFICTGNYVTFYTNSQILSFVVQHINSIFLMTSIKLKVETLEDYTGTIPLITDTCQSTNVGRTPMIKDPISFCSKNMG